MAEPGDRSTSFFDVLLSRPVAESDDGGEGIGPTLGPDVSPEHERELIERECRRRGLPYYELPKETGEHEPRAFAQPQGSGELKAQLSRGGPQRVETMSEAPDQSRPAAQVEMQDEPGASGLDSSAYGGGLGAGAQDAAASPPLDLDPSLLRTTGVGGAGQAGGTGLVAGDVGGANASGFGASLHASPDRTPPLSAPPGGDQPQSENEQQSERRAHGLAQGGASPEKTAPDQTRAEGVQGSIDDTDGL